MVNIVKSKIPGQHYNAAHLTCSAVPRTHDLDTAQLNVGVTGVVIIPTS